MPLRAAARLTAHFWKLRDNQGGVSPACLAQASACPACNPQVQIGTLLLVCPSLHA